MAKATNGKALQKSRKSPSHVAAAQARWESAEPGKRHRALVEGLRLLSAHPEGLTSIQFYDKRWPDGTAERKWGAANRYLDRVLEAFPGSIRRDGDGRSEGGGAWHITPHGTSLLRKLDSRPSQPPETRKPGRVGQPRSEVRCPCTENALSRALRRSFDCCVKRGISEREIARANAKAKAAAAKRNGRNK